VYHFFFQAEDGIRDRNVTGVQTCALPILKQKVHTYSLGMRQRLCFAMIVAADTPVMLMDEVMNGLDVANVELLSNHLIQMKQERSEERRVGKEWRWRWRAEQ